MTVNIVHGRRDDFLRPLQIVSGIVARNAQMPILGNVLIRKSGSELALLSSDGDMQITTMAAIGFGEDVAATTVAARKLGEIVRALPEGGQVKLSLSAERLLVQSGKSRFQLQVLPAEQFPVLKSPEEWDAHVTLPQKTLRQLIELVHFSMASNDIRYYLNGLLLRLDGTRVIAVTTDGHRLSYAHAEVEERMERRELILPSKVVLELKRQLEMVDEPVELLFAGQQLRCNVGDTVLDFKAVEGKFPSYERVIPTANPNMLAVDRMELRQSLHRAALLTDDKHHVVRCRFRPGVASFTATNPTQEEAEEELEIEYDGAEIEIALNVQYLLAVLDNLAVEKVSIAMLDGSSSILCTIPERDDFKYVLMPVRA